jgi:hypothetical protein
LLIKVLFYLHENCFFFKVIKETVARRWPRVDYFKNTLLVITVPAEFSEKSKIIMRTCAYNASLIKEEYSTNLQIITERKNPHN